MERGFATIEAKDGNGMLYAQDYAAHVALELGADFVKLREPEGKVKEDEVKNVHSPFTNLSENTAARSARAFGRPAARLCSRRARSWRATVLPVAYQAQISIETVPKL